MYVTTANECHALDAGSGRRLWDYRRPRTKGLAGDAAGGINRGVAVAGDRVFMVTDNAHLLALDRFTGALLWDTEMADSRQNYGATSAPLAVGGLVISGTLGRRRRRARLPGRLRSGDGQGGVALLDGAQARRAGIGDLAGQGHRPSLRHRLAHRHLRRRARHALLADGQPLPGLRRQRSAWATTSTRTRSSPSTPKTGRLKWHFQYTPHDVWDWDAQQPPVLVDADWQGQPRRLLLHANRNGFFYVLDRTNGRAAAGQAVRQEAHLGARDRAGRPSRAHPRAGADAAEGRTVCPAVEGATNWFSTVVRSRPPASTTCRPSRSARSTRARPGSGRPGKSYYGGTTQRRPDEPGQKVLRAIDIQTGAIAWELPQTGAAQSWGGVLATASGLVFFGEDGGALVAVDAASGAPLWHFQANALWKASPMTYVFDGQAVRRGRGGLHDPRLRAGGVAAWRRVLLDGLWLLLVLLVTVAGMWLSSSLALYLNGPRWLASRWACLAFPVLPLAWEALRGRDAARATRSLRPPFFTVWDRMVLRTLAVNLLIVGVLLARWPDRVLRGPGHARGLVPRGPHGRGSAARPARRCSSAPRAGWSGSTAPAHRQSLRRLPGAHEDGDGRPSRRRVPDRADRGHAPPDASDDARAGRAGASDFDFGRSGTPPPTTPAQGAGRAARAPRSASPTALPSGRCPPSSTRRWRPCPPARRPASLPWPATSRSARRIPGCGSRRCTTTSPIA